MDDREKAYYNKPDDDSKTDEAKLDKITRLADSLLKKRDEAIKGRAASGVERRWREDEEAFDGLDNVTKKSSMIDYATGEASFSARRNSPKRSSVIVNIIRGKCETAEGRFADIQFPVDDRNWGLKTTPVPELVDAMKDTKTIVASDNEGRTLSNAEVAKSQIDEAKQKMQAMETEIDDQLTECSFNAENRKVIRDSVRAGTGILKGPNVVKRLKKSWVKKEDDQTSIHVLEMIEEDKPESIRVNYWNVYPDPSCGEDIKKAAYIWERESILPRELRAMSGVEGYLSDQIYAILEEDPIRLTTAVNKDGSGYNVDKSVISQGNHYEKWEYNGEVNRDDLEALGVDLSSDTLKNKSLSACVVFINDRPVKAVLNTLDTGDLPYDFFQWTTVSGSVWGIGIPRMMIWQQRIITAAWRAMMDNAGDSSGVNVVVGYGIEPMDGIYELTGKKLWRAMSDVSDVNHAFAQFQVQNNQEPLERIIELALRFTDMETSLPMLFQGEKGEAPETLGATNIMIDANNVALRTRVKLWDDNITRPHIERYYDWNMQYNPKEEIKGDYNVDARGLSALLAKDQQSIALMNILPLRQDPEIAKKIDWDKALKQLTETWHLDILKSDEELAQADQEAANQGPPVDPRVSGSIEVAQIRTQGELQKAQLVQQSDMAELQFKAEEADRERQHEREMKTMEMQIKQMEFAQSSGLTLAQIKADLAKEASKQNLQRELSEKKAEGPQVANPPVEPGGRAPEGEAYQK